MLIDTHCHLDSENFPEGHAAAIERARVAGVSGFVCIGIGGSAGAREALALAAARSDVWATVGVHPHDASSFDEEYRAELGPWLAAPRLVAVGEVGLDFHYDHSPRERQRQVFREFIGIARRAAKPLVIHTRSAPEETLDILAEEAADQVGGVIHCFSEDVAFARRALDLNFDLSFSGILTFKSATAIQEAARFAPSERILVETDSPYLSPVPVRGKRCEPAYVAHTARFLAALRGVSFEALAELTTLNAARRFGLQLGGARPA